MIHRSNSTLLAAALFAAATSLGAQRPADGAQAVGEWRYHHRDLMGTRFAPLDQITRDNVQRLGIAWRWRPDTSERELRNESTPIVVRNTMYFPSGTNRGVVAVDAGSGAVKWAWSMTEGSRFKVAPRKGAGRGVSYWTDGTSERIFVVTPGFQLVALDARTGQQVPTFGNAGIVDLKLKLGVPLNVDSAAIGNSSPPVVYEDIVVIGPALEVGLVPKSKRNVPGRILAINARTGELVWRFNTIPQPGEFGNDTWEAKSWEYTGNAGAWAPMSVDVGRGLLYVPVEAATGDYYGGHRPGNNLFSTSLVCLDIRTGKRVWHSQIIHHDIWDWDNPTAPILADLDINGRSRAIVVQLTKQSFAYVFDRVSGAPIWPIEERPVPASEIPTEHASPTQPFPTKPAAFDRQGVTVDDLIDFTPELRAKALEVIKPFRLGPIFTPSSLLNAPDGTRGTLSLPGAVGGVNWEHATYDPEHGMLFVPTHTMPSVLGMAHVPERSDMDFVQMGGSPPTVSGLPLIKPPYNRVTAIDLHTGAHVWMVPGANTPVQIANNPALRGLTIPRTGGFGRPVTLATRTLLFEADGYGGEQILRAIDKASGATIAEINLPGSVASPPMSYMVSGRQFVAFWVSNATGGTRSELLALAVP
ncbi:MAG: PQQ-binding-like beta-propeller repeat protein [Gemmatimonadaceae bacterium]